LIAFGLLGKHGTGVHCDISVTDININHSKMSLSVPVIAIGAAINFTILSVGFSLILSTTTPLFYAVLRGITLALIATVVTLVIDLITGGLGTLMLLPIYIFSAILLLILSIVRPRMLEKDDGQLSGFYLVSFSFWPIFIIGMIIALVMGLSLTYLASRFSSSIMDMVNNLDLSQFVSGRRL